MNDCVLSVNSFAARVVAVVVFVVLSQNNALAYDKTASSGSKRPDAETSSREAAQLREVMAALEALKVSAGPGCLTRSDLRSRLEMAVVLHDSAREMDTLRGQTASQGSLGLRAAQALDTAAAALAELAASVLIMAQPPEPDAGGPDAPRGNGRAKPSHSGDQAEATMDEATRAAVQRVSEMRSAMQARVDERLAARPLWAGPFVWPVEYEQDRQAFLGILASMRPAVWRLPCPALVKRVEAPMEFMAMGLAALTAAPALEYAAGLAVSAPADAGGRALREALRKACDRLVMDMALATSILSRCSDSETDADLGRGYRDAAALFRHVGLRLEALVLRLAAF